MHLSKYCPTYPHPGRGGAYMGVWHFLIQLPRSWGNILVQISSNTPILPPPPPPLIYTVQWYRHRLLDELNSFKSIHAFIHNCTQLNNFHNSEHIKDWLNNDIHTHPFTAWITGYPILDVCSDILTQFSVGSGNDVGMVCTQENKPDCQQPCVATHIEQTHAHARTYVHTHAHTYTCTCTHMHTHTHACMHMHAHKHKHTPTHAYTAKSYL